MKFGVLSIFHIAFKTKVHMFGLSSNSVWAKILTKLKMRFLNGHITVWDENKIPDHET